MRRSWQCTGGTGQPVRADRAALAATIAPLTGSQANAMRGATRWAQRAGTSGGEHEHLALAPSGDQGAADLLAVHAWQVAVQHDHVVAVDRGAVQGGLAIPRHIGGYALAAQHVGNRLGQLLVIFDEQYPHQCLPLAGV
jgi:hypothetical protein